MVDGGQRGKVFVVNVWGSWCPPCIEETPAAAEGVGAGPAEGRRRVHRLDKMESPEAAAFQKANKVTYPSLATTERRRRSSPSRARPPATPTTLVLDQQGRIAARVFGAIHQHADRARRRRARREGLRREPVVSHRHT